MLAIYNQRRGHIPHVVQALVKPIFSSRDAHTKTPVALDAVFATLRLSPMKLGTDDLPACSNEHVSIDVENPYRKFGERIKVVRQ
jgi:hypothetical protein